jgi:hypothetical protein
MLIRPSKALRETVELVANFQKLAPKKLLQRFERSNDRAMTLFGILATSTKATHDQEVRRRAGMSIAEYQRAIWKLKTALLESLLEIDLAKGGYSQYAQQLHRLELAHARVNTLRRLGSAYSANTEAMVWIKQAQRLEKWDIAFSLLGALMRWATLSGNVKEFDRMKRERLRVRTLQDALDDAEEADDRVTIIFAKSGAEHPELRPMIDAALARLEPVLEMHETFTLKEVELRLRKKAQQVVMHFHDALRICDEADTLLDKYPLFDHRLRRARNTLSRVVCLVQLREFAKARSLLHAQSNLFSEGTQNWYTFQEWQVMFLMHTKEHDGAYDVVKQVMESGLFESQSQTTQDRWHLFQLYAEYFTKRRMPDHNLLQLFSSFTKDYAGYRFSAVMLEILLVLRLGDKAALVERIDSLAKYKSRYLRKTAPTRIFINICQYLIRYDFEKKKIAPRAAPYIRKIIDTEEGDPIMEAQVLYYDQFWELFMAMLPDEGKLFPDEE